MIDAGGMGRFPALPGIERLTIIVDNDVERRRPEGRSGTRARWEAAGLRVRTVMPSTPGHDLNDILVALEGPAVTRSQFIIDETSSPSSPRQRAALPRMTARKVLRRHSRRDR